MLRRRPRGENEAGNRRQSTDARGRTVNHAYDALDRLASSTWAGEAIAYAWDQGPHGIGRISSITDASGTTQYAYDAAGRVITDTRVISGVTLATTYAYDAAGRLSLITYPSGRQVSYAYDGAGRISGVSLTAGGTTTALASSITYSPFGGITGLALGPASLAYARTYDLDGRVTSYKLGSVTHNLTYDAAGNVTRLADPAVPAQDRVFSYDKADRLLSLSTTPSSLNQGYTYDKVGNRLSRTVNGVATAYTMAAASNRLSAVGAVTRSYDASGNQLGDGTRAFTYDDRGRMSGATTPLGPVTYALNALGQRVRKTVGTVTTAYAYDLNGHLLGEYDGAGTAIQEIAWLGDTPIAAMRAGTSGTDLFPIWTDHLDTPRLVTNTAGTARWEWPSTDPFGANLPNENPAGLGAFQFNLRFPGQLHDPETGTHYNYFRDYDPGIGRYVQSDPIGLEGGINTYGYVDADPVSSEDPYGLKRKPRKPPKPIKPFPMPGSGNSLGDGAGYFNPDGEFVCIRWHCPKNPDSCSPYDTKKANDFIPASTDPSKPPAGCTCDDPRYRLRNGPGLKDPLDWAELGVKGYMRFRR